jgi:peptidase M16-like protein
MGAFVNRFAWRLLVLLAVVSALARSSGAATLMPDSTTVDRWTLPNGLEVLTRHVPRARSLSCALGFRTGSDADPAKSPGTAELLAELEFTAPAGEIPERTRDQMESLRPNGWTLRVGPRSTVLMEAASATQFPGVLHQLAVRLRGVTVSAAALDHARVMVRHSLGDHYFGSPASLLWWQVRAYARGLSQADIVQLASGRALDGVGVRDAQQALQAAFSPSNAVLSVVGDLSAWDVRRIIEQEFGAVPAGPAPPPLPVHPLGSAAVTLPRPDVSGPIGVVAVLAPALSDTLYPSYFLAMLMISQHTADKWGPALPPLTTRFSYPVLDDPTMARFYPKLDANQKDLQALGEEFANTQDELAGMIVTAGAEQAVINSAQWLLGGPMPLQLVDRIRADPAALNEVCVDDALRGLLGSDGFWAEFRERLNPMRVPGPSNWNDYVSDPTHLARVLLVPGGRR